nr:hypothetical protein [Brucella anthropi]
MAKHKSSLKQNDEIHLGSRPPSYVSRARLAVELDIGESTVDDYVRRGLLPRPVRIGGAVRWSWSQVQALLEADTSYGVQIDPFMEGVKNVAQTS